MANEIDDDVAVMDVSEVEEIRSGRPSTDANVFIQILVGVVGTVALALGLFPLEGTRMDYVYAIVNERGFVQYGELFMSFMVLALMVLKARIVKNQLKVVASNPIPMDIDMSDDEQLQNLRDSVVRRDEFSWSIILNRMDRAIALWLSTKDVGRVSTWAQSESTRDTSSSDSSYSLCRVLIWAIPIMGFIGTVMGLATAVAGFGVLGGSADINAIKEAIGQVTVGLGVAFDTTLLALILTVFLMFPLSFIQRNEENLFVELDNYLDDMFLARLPSPEQQPIVIENLEDSIEAAFRRYIPDPDRYDEVFTRAIDKAAGVVEEKFGALSRSYEATLRDITGQLAGNIAGVGDSLQATMSGVIADLSKKEEELLANRRKLSEEEAQQFRGLLEGVQQSASGIVEEYRKVAGELKLAGEEGMTKSVEAAQTLASKMDEVAKLAGGIQELLHVQQSIEKSMSGIASSDEFRKTMEDLRNHLNITNDFCTRLSKPRVITLKEEIV